MRSGESPVDLPELEVGSGLPLGPEEVVGVHDSCHDRLNFGTFINIFKDIRVELLLCVLRSSAADREIE